MDHRLVALDMDGTLLDGDGNIPEGFWEVLAEARSRGITLAPASGRQLVTLRDMFGERLEPGTFIAENGTVVAHHGEIVSTTPLDPAAVHSVIDVVRAADTAMDLVLCTPTMAYLDRWFHPDSTGEVDKYYHATELIDDLHERVADDVIKLAVFTHDDAETVGLPVLEPAAGDSHVVVSGKHWIDIMNREADKGRAFTALREALGLEKSQTLAFGDYLNDYELLTAAGTAYAMDNAHPRIKEIADEVAPPNTEHGVITVLREMLGM